MLGTHFVDGEYKVPNGFVTAHGLGWEDRSHDLPHSM